MKTSKFDMMEFIKKLHKKNRALLSDEFTESLDFIGTFISLKYHEYSTGTKVWTWKIPKKWIFKDAYIVDCETRKKIVDARQNLLHVHINSCPIDKEVSHEELMSHLSYNEDFPDAVPYVCKYYREDWGFSIRYNDISKFNSKKYKVKIDSNLVNGKMTVGEFTIKGRSDETILFPIHLDHPWQCNDNLSGCAVAIDLIFRLLDTSNLRYSYKFLFLPETIGTIAFLAKNKKILPLLKYGIVFDSVGNDAPLTLTTTKDNVSLINKYAIYSLKKIEADYKVNGFFDDEHLMSANDERVLQAPFLNIPSIAFSRSPFKEYHTDKDSPEIIHKKMLKQISDIVYETIMILEKDFRVKQNYDGILCLSEYDLWDETWTTHDSIVIEKILHLLTGELSIFEIAEKVEASFEFVYDFIIKLKQKNLITID